MKKKRENDDEEKKEHSYIEQGFCRSIQLKIEATVTNKARNETVRLMGEKLYKKRNGTLMFDTTR